MDLGPQAATIAMCYAAVVLVVGGLIAWLVADGRRLAQQLADLEERGIRRRSAQTLAKPPAPEPNTRT